MTSDIYFTATSWFPGKCPGKTPFKAQCRAVGRSENSRGGVICPPWLQLCNLPKYGPPGSYGSAVDSMSCQKYSIVTWDLPFLSLSLIRMSFLSDFSDLYSYDFEASIISWGRRKNDFTICRLWAEIEAHKWRDLELNLSKTATKAIEFWSVGTSWSVKNAHFALFITD